MNRKYVIASSVALGVVAFVTITSHLDGVREERMKEDRARIEAEHEEQRQAEAQRAPPPDEQPPGGVTTSPSSSADLVSATLRDERTKYVARLDVQVQTLERQIDDLQAASRGATADLRTDYDRLFNDVGTRRDTLRNDIASINAATDATWEPLKTRIDVDLQDLERSVRVASWRIKSPARRAPR